MVCQVLGVAIGTFILYYDIIDLSILTSLAMLANIAFILFFKKAEHINHKLYTGAKIFGLGVYTLTEKFQLSENIRTIRIMKRVVIMTGFMNIICQVTMVTTIISKDNIVREAAVSIFNFTILCIAILFVIIPMYTIPAWRRKSINIFKNIRIKLCFKNRVHEKSPTPLVLRTLSGDRMTFNVLEERDMYFQSLSNAWNSAPLKN
ncbi:CRE-SRE-11 protein [Aphelenchoides bicaudatus]|nr:CRE-SRE-11 protein [Aphelenchoides bicaudatus]